MKPLKIKSHAKINLSLDILAKKGKYHKIRTILQQIALYDTIILKQTEKNKILIKSNDKFVPLTTKNLAYQAAEIIKKTGRVKKGVEIFIDKHIPVASGFGGGSSNAAAVLKGLNEMWKLKLSKAKLQKMAEKLGMDVAFFLTNGAAIGSHFGEKIHPLKPCKGLILALFIPNKKSPLPLKTKNIYKKINLKRTGHSQKQTKLLITAIKKGNKQAILDNLHNDIETAVNISEIKNTLFSAGASNALLAGSGPSIVAFFRTRLNRKKCLKTLDKKFKKQFRVIFTGV